MLRASPLWQIQNGRQRLDDLSAHCQLSLVHRLQLQRAHVTGLRSRLLTLNPLAVLDRGFAMVSRTDGSLVRSISQAKVGYDIQVQVADGKFTAEVTKGEG